MTSQLTCAYCGGTDFIACKQTQGYASVIPAHQKTTFNGQILYHDICKNCGTVARSYIEHPEKLN